jgi:integrase/recombinase XerD
MSERWRCVSSGPLAPHAKGFDAELSRLGYSPSAAKKHLLLMAALSRRLDAEGLDVGEMTTAGVELFFRERRREGRANLLTVRALEPLLGYLRRAGLVSEPREAVVTGPVDVFLRGYRLYLVRERGLVEGTVNLYVRIARLFVSERLAADGLDLAHLTAAEVTDFATRACKRRRLSSARQTISALRSLLRFLRMTGATESALDQAVLSVAGWSSSLPRAIEADHAARLLASCDQGSSIGRRDYAILAMLVRLGLRAGEVVALELGDIDWRRGEIVVHGKRHREERLPLPADVGEAVAGYLQQGRPHSDSRHLFLRCNAPFSELSAWTGAIRSVVARACERAGLPHASPHRLRHTAATQMLRAGAPLSEIAQVLRHRSATTTATYAKVDHARLRELARRWPGDAA